MKIFELKPYREGYKMIASCDFSYNNGKTIEVKKGDVGGYIIEGAKVEGNTWVDENSYVGRDAVVTNSIIENTMLENKVEVNNSLVYNLRLNRTIIRDSIIYCTNKSIIRSSNINSSSITVSSLNIDSQELINEKIIDTIYSKVKVINYTESEDNISEEETRIGFIDIGNGLYRIKALTNFLYIKEGEIGGVVSSKKNIEQNGKSWISKDSAVVDNAIIRGNAIINDNSILYDNTIVEENARLSNTVLQGNIKISSDVNIKNTRLIGNANIYLNSKIEGDSSSAYLSSGEIFKDGYEYKVINNKITEEEVSWIDKYGTN